MVAHGWLKVVAIIPKVTASLSISSSIAIILIVIKNSKSNHAIPVQRALMGMSFIDIIASSGWWLSTWAVPRDTDVPVAFAAGTTGSCIFQGILLQIAIGSPLYNASLALYYLLIIRYKWTNHDLIKIEPWIHGVILTFTFGTGFGLIPIGIYNHVGTVCWIIGKPRGCGNSSTIPSDIPCERGDWAWIYGIALFYAPLWFCICFTVVAMILIQLEVAAVSRQITRYSLGDRTRSGDIQSSLVDPRKVATQAALYTGAFFITWLPSTIWSVTSWVSTGVFWLDIASATCEPLQGLWNFLVFIRRRKDLREKARTGFKRLLCYYCRSDDIHGSRSSISIDEFGDPRVVTMSRASMEVMGRSGAIERDVLPTVPENEGQSAVSGKQPKPGIGGQER